MELVALVLVVIVLLLLINRRSSSYSYRVRGPLFTPAERSFLGVLDSAIADKYRVFGKVRVADVISPKKGMSRKNWQSAFNKISAKHFDYVVCSKDTLEVLAVVELDDKSHRKASTQQRDKFLKSACSSANLKLIRFPAKTSYKVVEVREVVEYVINKPEGSVSNDV